MSNMVEDNDDTYIGSSVSGTKRSSEAVGQWGESSVDSTTTVLYPHKKTRPTHGPGVPGTVSNQHIYANSVDNNIGAEIYGINGFGDERQIQLEIETRDSTFSTTCSTVPCDVTKGDLVVIGKSLEVASYDTCFGMVGKTATLNRPCINENVRLSLKVSNLRINLSRGKNQKT